MNLIIEISELLLVILFVGLSLAVLYIFIFAFASLFKYKIHYPETVRNRKIAVLIPGYKEDAVIVDVAKQALKQTYDESFYDVIIIADSFQPKTLNQLKKLPIILVEVVFEVSTKSKALNEAMRNIGDDYDIAVVLDADNIMKEDFLDKINRSFENGFSVVQGHRIAKNLNTSFAVLDAISEEVNNSIFRKGHRVLGLSSALIGSGMAFDYRFFKETMANVQAVGGFDKELELKLLRDKTKIEYLEDAIVLDEKVQKAEVFANQRKRWLSAQLIYFRRFFFSGLSNLILRGNVDFFDKVIQMIQPPRVVLLGLTSIITLIVWICKWLGMESGLVPGIYWIYLLIITYTAFLFAIPGTFYTKKTLSAVMSLPKAFFIMILSFFKLKGANKKFIHTQHGTEE